MSGVSQSSSIVVEVTVIKELLSATLFLTDSEQTKDMTTHPSRGESVLLSRRQGLNSRVTINQAEADSAERQPSTRQPAKGTLPFQPKPLSRRHGVSEATNASCQPCHIALCLMVASICIGYWWMMYSLFYIPSSKVRLSAKNRFENLHAQDKVAPTLRFMWYNESNIKSPILNNENKTNDVYKTTNKIIHVGMFGLGHRLSKLAASYHFAQTYAAKHWPVNNLHVSWGYCDPDPTMKSSNHTTENNNNNNKSSNSQFNNTDIFEYLFGNNIIAIQGSQTTQKQEQQGSETFLQYREGKSLVIRNDVVGYYAGQVYKNAQIPLRKYLPLLGMWEEKLDFDAELFKNLLASFERKHGANTVEKFQRQYKWDEHYVIGLHVRAGNGEQAHFTQSERGITQMNFYDNLVDTIQNFVMNTNVSIPVARPRKRPILIFLATDTQQVLQILQSRFAKIDLRVVSLPQPRVADQQGVSYATWTQGSEHCWNGWLYSMSDMALLSKSNVIIAARRSTFTQILPRSILMDQTEILRSEEEDKDYSIFESRFKRQRRRLWNQRGYKFCEMSRTAQSMSCFTKRNAWLFRHELDDFSQEGYVIPAIKTFGKAANTNGNIQEGDVHKLLVHFPDVFFDHNGTSELAKEEEEDVNWLRRGDEFWGDTGKDRLLFGFKISKKYRKFQEFRGQWSF